MARKILLADDSVTAQNMGRKILADAGYDVITVNNGSAALKRLSEIRPDLIVLDVYMPGYSGLEVCQRLKESSETAHIPVLLTVGKLEPFKPEEARRARADAHIVKPFEASELLTAITKLEDRMVPQQGDGSRFSASTAGVERFSGEPAGRKSQGGSEIDNGWKNRIRFPSKKKKEEEPEPEDVAVATTGATFRDFRKGKTGGKQSAVPEAAVIPDIPRDITPEELDALSAVAEKLDVPETAPAKAETSAPMAEAHKEIQVAEVQPQPKDAENETKIEAVATPLVESLQASETATTSAIGEAPAPTAKNEESAMEQESARIGSEHVEVAPVHPAALSVSDELPVVAAAVVDAEAKELEVTTSNELPEDRAANVESAAATVSNIAKNDESADAPSVIAAAPVPPTEAQPQEQDKEKEVATPSDAELAEALRLLTPAPSAADTAPSNGNVAANSQLLSEEVMRSGSTGPRWVAETVALTAEESKLSLESEMFGTSSPANMSAAAPLGDFDPDRSIGLSGIAAAVENRLAEAGLGGNSKTWASQHENSVENAAAEAAAALEASAQLLAAATAATPVVDQIGAEVERKMTGEFSIAPDQLPANDEPEYRGSTATFADAMSKSESDYTGGNAVLGSEQSVSEVTAAPAENQSSDTEVGGDNSMGKDGKTKSGKSNWHEIRTAPQSAPETDLVEAAKQTAPAENPQKSMAAAAAESSGSAGSSTDAGTIASIVDSVMADLRPRIVEEIARKLSGK